MELLKLSKLLIANIKKDTGLSNNHKYIRIMEGKISSGPCK